MDNLFKLRSASMRKRLLKAYDPSQPRDERGRWTDTGAGTSTGRFTTTGADLRLPSSAHRLLTALRASAQPVEFIPSSEGGGARVKDGPWRAVSPRRVGFEPGAETSHLLYVLRTRDLIRNHEGESVLVRMVDQGDWWNP